VKAKNPAAVALGRLGGLTKSAKKAASSRANAAKARKARQKKGKAKPMKTATALVVGILLVASARGEQAGTASGPRFLKQCAKPSQSQTGNRRTRSRLGFASVTFRVITTPAN